MMCFMYVVYSHQVGGTAIPRKTFRSEEKAKEYIERESKLKSREMSYIKIEVV